MKIKLLLASMLLLVGCGQSLNQQGTLPPVIDNKVKFTVSTVFLNQIDPNTPTVKVEIVNPVTNELVSNAPVSMLSPGIYRLYFSPPTNYRIGGYMGACDKSLMVSVEKSDVNLTCGIVFYADRPDPVYQETSSIVVIIQGIDMANIKVDGVYYQGVKRYLVLEKQKAGVVHTVEAWDMDDGSKKYKPDYYKQEMKLPVGGTSPFVINYSQIGICKASMAQNC